MWKSRPSVGSYSVAGRGNAQAQTAQILMTMLARLQHAMIAVYGHRIY
jgi:hypothetical protein